MALKYKYLAVLALGEQLGVQNGKAEEADGVFRIWGTVETEHDRKLLWDKIKEIGGDAPADIKADIAVTNPHYYARYTVGEGDTLDKIAKYFYGDPAKYMQIFNANTAILAQPDRIEIGQELVIPFEQ